MITAHTPLHGSCLRSTGLLLALSGTLLSNSSNAQTTLWSEEFDGGVSTTGFTVDNNVSDCYWTFAPDSVHEGATFSQDFSGAWPTGPGMDSSFVFLDSDECGASGIVVNSFLTSAAFDASAFGTYRLDFTHQFRARLQSFIHVDAWNGAAWTEVYHHTGSDVGYPNPTVLQSVDISNATGGSAEAKVRFQFSAGWDWWWALDSIRVVHEFNLGVSDLAEASMGVYPNPAKDQLNLGRRPAGTTKLVVYNAIGEQVLNSSTTAPVDVQDLPPGMYVLEAVDASGRPLSRARFVKE